MHDLPPLTGPPSCIESASKIRHRILRLLRSYAPPGWVTDPAACLKVLERQTMCSFWIYVRGYKLPGLYRTAQSLIERTQTPQQEYPIVTIPTIQDYMENSENAGVTSRDNAYLAAVAHAVLEHKSSPNLDDCTTCKTLSTLVDAFDDCLTIIRELKKAQLQPPSSLE